MDFDEIPFGAPIRVYSSFGPGRKFLGSGVLRNAFIQNGQLTYNGTITAGGHGDPEFPWYPDPLDYDCVQSASGEYLIFKRGGK